MGSTSGFAAKIGEADEPESLIRGNIEEIFSAIDMGHLIGRYRGRRRPGDPQISARSPCVRAKHPKSLIYITLVLHAQVRND